MGIIKQFDKRSGITYVYENQAYWDPEKKQSRAKRKLIGRWDPETETVIPTDGRNRQPKAKNKEQDYKALYEKLEKKYEAQQSLIEALQEEIRKLKEK